MLFNINIYNVIDVDVAMNLYNTNIFIEVHFEVDFKVDFDEINKKLNNYISVLIISISTEMNVFIFFT